MGGTSCRRNFMISLPDSPDGFKPRYIDLLLATVAAIRLPIFASLVLGMTGALIPLVLYYGVFSWGVVRWRRGAVGFVVVIMRGYSILPYLMME